MCQTPWFPEEKLHLLWENIRKNIITILLFFCWKSQKHHGFCWGETGSYHFPLHNMWKKTKRRLLVVLAYPEAKARVRKTILKQKQDLLGVMSSKSFKRKPIGACWFQRIVFEENLHPTKKLWKKNTCVSPIFLQLSFGVNISPKLCVCEEQEQRLREIEEDRLLANRKVKPWDVEDEELGDWWCRRLLFFMFTQKLGKMIQLDECFCADELKQQM